MFLKVKLRNIITQHYLLLLVLLVFVTHFSLISIVNHQCFRTYALDLGMFSHEMYQYGQLKLPQFTLGLHEPMPVLADHWAPILGLVSPLRFIFGEYTLLILQIAGLAFAAIYIYRIALHYQLNRLLAAGTSVFFLSMWGITSALAFDFHTNVLAACFFPALYFNLLRQRWLAVAIVTVLILLTKENMGFWLMFAFGGFWVRGLFLKSAGNWLHLLFAGVSCSVFLLLVFVVIPSYAGGQHHNLTQFFGHISPDMKEVAWYFLSHPGEVFKLLFMDTVGIPSQPKMDSWIMMTISGLVFICWRPWTGILMIPLISQKFLTGDEQVSGIHGQYSIEFAPIAALAIAASLASLRSDHWRYMVLALSVFVAAKYNIREIFPHNERTNVWGHAHYQPAINPEEFKACMNFLPRDASVSCSSALAPHLAFRDSIYHYPIHNQAEYILLIAHPFASYPATGEEYLKEIESWASNPEVNILYRGRDLILIRKTR